MNIRIPLLLATRQRIVTLTEKLTTIRAKEANAIQEARVTGNNLWVSGDFWHDRRHTEESLRAAVMLHEILSEGTSYGNIEQATSL